MRILGFGTYDTSKHPRVGIVLDGFRAHADAVREVNVPLGFTTSERVEMLARPWTAFPLIRRLAVTWARLAQQGRAAVRRQGPADAVIVGYLGQFDVLLARVLFPRTTLILDQLVFASDTARDRRLDTGLKVRALLLLDWAAATCADIVLVDTEEQLALLPVKRRERGIVVPVGAPDSWFAAGRSAQGALSDLAPSPEAALKVVFFGLFTPLQGAPVIGEALGQLADLEGLSVTMIGHGQDLDQAKSLGAANRNVSWVDWMAADELATLVAESDVCLGIFGTTPKGRRVVPNKVYQGAAAGCAIVTSDTGPQRRALGEAAIFVPPGDAAALAAALRGLSADRRVLGQMKQRARLQAEANFSAERIIEPLRRVLTLRLASHQNQSDTVRPHSLKIFEWRDSGRG